MTITFRDVKADLLNKITQGIYPPGSLMPNEVELAQSYDCARATVNRAMRELAEEGLIERRRKAGTRVRMAPVREARFGIPLVRREIEDSGASYGYRLLEREVLPAPEWLRRRFGLAEGAEAVHLTCLHLADGTPYQFEERWINLAMLPNAAEADFTASGPNEWLVSEVPYSDAQISFLAVQADAALAERLACAQGAALFRVERSTWWEGAAITYVQLTFREGHRMTTHY